MNFSASCIIVVRFGPVTQRLMLLKQEALLLQSDHVTRLSVEILQLQNIPFKNDCNQQMTLLEVYTPKVIAIAAFR